MLLAIQKFKKRTNQNKVQCVISVQCELAHIVSRVRSILSFRCSEISTIV
jgi:hypothetical protein